MKALRIIAAYHSGVLRMFIEPVKRYSIRETCLLVMVGLAIDLVMLPFTLPLLGNGLQDSSFFLICLLVPVMWLIGFQRPAFSLICLVWLTNEPRIKDAAMFGQVFGTEVGYVHLLCLMVLIQSFFWRFCRRIPNIYASSIILIFLGGSFGVFFAGDPKVAIEALTLRMLIPTIISFNCIRAFRREDLEQLWLCLVIMMAVVATYNVSRSLYAFGFEHVIFDRMWLGRNTLMELGVVAFVPSVILGLNHSKMFYRLLAQFSAIMIVILIWLQMNRIGIVLSTCFILIVMGIRFRLLFIRCILVLGLGALVVWGWLVQWLKTLDLPTALERFGDFFSSRMCDDGRWEIWSVAIDLINKNIIFGIGMNNFYLKTFYFHAHQIFLSMWLDTGFVGLIGFSMLLVYLLVALHFCVSRAQERIIKEKCQIAQWTVILMTLFLQFDGVLYSHGSDRVGGLSNSAEMGGSYVFCLVMVGAFVSLSLYRKNDEVFLKKRQQLLSS